MHLIGRADATASEQISLRHASEMYIFCSYRRISCFSNCFHWRARDVTRGRSFLPTTRSRDGDIKRQHPHFMQIIFSLLQRTASERHARLLKISRVRHCSRFGPRLSDETTRRADYFISLCARLMATHSHSAVRLWSSVSLSWLAADLNSRCDGTLLLLFANST